jgi:hypothetical protein
MTLNNILDNNYRKSVFQKSFNIKSEVYTAEQIREAIKNSFQDVGEHRGLLRIVLGGEIIYSGNQKSPDLDILIPEITSKTIIPNPLPYNYIYGVIEGNITTQLSSAKTFFIPTEKGYLCDSMKINEHYFTKEI